MPKPNPVADLAANMVQALQRRRETGDDQILTVAQLAAQLEPPAEVADVLKALKKKPFAAQLLAARPEPNSPVVLASDADRLASSPLLLDYALGQLYKPGKVLHALASVVAKVDKRLQPAFAAVLTQQVTDNTLPSLAGARTVRDKPHLYLKAFPPPLKPEQALAEKLVQVLQAEKHSGRYPTTLKQLVTRAEADSSPELAKAVAHKAFKSQVIVAAAKNQDSPVALAVDMAEFADSAALLEFAVGLLSTAKKPLHPVAKVVAKVDARLREAFAAAIGRRLAGELPPAVALVHIKDVPHLCLRIYLPRVAPEVELAGNLLRSLQAHKQSGDYPVTLDRLLLDNHADAPSEVVAKALAAKSFKPHVLLALPNEPHTPLALRDDADQLARWPSLIEMVLAKARTAENQALPTADLAKKLAKELRGPFAAAVDMAVGAATLPVGVGCVRIKAKPYLFLVGDVGAKPVVAAAPTVIDFAARFDEAFGEIDRQMGSHNFVSLVDLRRALPVDAAAFEDGLRQLRQEGQYTLSGAEGRHGITDAERTAGVNENGALLLYVSRRQG